MQSINRKRRWNIPLTMRTRLVLGYASVLSIFLLLGLVNFSYLNRMMSANSILEQETKNALAAVELSRNTLEVAAAIDEGILLQDSTNFGTNVSKAVEKLVKQQAIVQQLIGETTRLDFAIASFLGFVDPMLRQANAGSWDVIQRNRLTRLGNSIVRMSDEIDSIVSNAEETQRQALSASTQARQTFFRNMVISFFLAVTLSSFLVYTTVTDFSRRVKNVIAGAQLLAAGELDRRVEEESDDEIGQLAQTFNKMATELESLYLTLEERIVERTAELENMAGQLRASAEVAGAATTVLDPDVLLKHVVQLISERFNFYHTGIFLLDDTRNFAILRAASSAGGQRMLERRHQLKVGQGVVGNAIELKAAHVSQDVGADTVFFNNPDLPETRSEVALPLRARGRIVGALDVQSTEQSAFNKENVSILQTLADQVALAIDNALLYREAQNRLEEVNRLYGEYSQQGWQNVARQRKGLSYRYSPDSGVTAGQPLSHQMKLAVQSGQIFSGSDAPEQNSSEQTVVPIRVRDQVIGILEVSKPPDTGYWTLGEQSLLNTLVEQLGIALESARMFNESKRRAEQERLIGDITSHMRETLDVEAVLKTTAQQVRNALGLPEVTVRLSVPDSQAETSRSTSDNGSSLDGNGYDSYNSKE